jgi:hypothetical protein
MRAVHLDTPKEVNRLQRAKKLAVVLALTGCLSAIAAPAFANAPPPTNGGNGAGKSGQCTGNPDGRPASCH